jgi:hypothetical protein
MDDDSILVLFILSHPQLFDDTISVHLTSFDRGVLALASKDMEKHLLASGLPIGPVSINRCQISESLAQWSKEHSAEYKPGCASYATFWKIRCIRSSVTCGDLDALRWMRAQKHAWHDTLERWALVAARYGQLDVLKWFVSIGCRKQEQIGHIAAQWGHVNVLEWLLVGGAFTKLDVRASAVEGKQAYVLRWLEARKRAKQ